METPTKNFQCITLVVLPIISRTISESEKYIGSNDSHQDDHGVCIFVLQSLHSLPITPSPFFLRSQILRSLKTLPQPTVMCSDGSKRIKSRNSFQPGSDPEFVWKKGQNTKFCRNLQGSSSRAGKVKVPRMVDRSLRYRLVYR